VREKFGRKVKRKMYGSNDMYLSPKRKKSGLRTKAQLDARKKRLLRNVKDYSFHKIINRYDSTERWSSKDGKVWHMDSQKYKVNKDGV